MAYSIHFCMVVVVVYSDTIGDHISNNQIFSYCCYYYYCVEMCEF